MGWPTVFPFPTPRNTWPRVSPAVREPASNPALRVCEAQVMRAWRNAPRSTDRQPTAYSDESPQMGRTEHVHRK